jgi:N-acetyl-gamma-glutamylphosphate reductase
VQLHSSGERVVAVGGLDNLLKGAATQCLQVSELEVPMSGKPMNCIAEFEPCTWI